MTSTSQTGTQDARMAEISNAVVQITRKHTGHGPKKARTHINDELVTCVLWDCLTKSERTLVESGRSDPVIRSRKHLQAAMRRDFVDAVERITEREVLAFMSDQHVEPDIAIEAFVLKPPPAPAPDLAT
jgi:uncharacterized protein YbcI